MLAIRKDHGEPPLRAKRGDLFQVILFKLRAAMRRSQRQRMERGSALWRKSMGLALCSWRHGRKGRLRDSFR